MHELKVGSVLLPGPLPYPKHVSGAVNHLPVVESCLVRALLIGKEETLVGSVELNGSEGREGSVDPNDLHEAEGLVDLGG
jgi:hypothetical protein